MDKLHYKEMVSRLEWMIQRNMVQNRVIYLFGHCNATEELIDLLLKKGLNVKGILDNNVEKHGKKYKEIVIQSPQKILEEKTENTIVCIVARAYESMADQLKRLGFKGVVYKLVDYNSYANYSFSNEAIIGMKERVERGKILLDKLHRKYVGSFFFLCPFSALGDIYFMMSYLPYFVQKRGIQQYVICVIGNACAQVVQLFGEYDVEIFLQKDMDEIVQAALYVEDTSTFIPHQDRPYVVNLHKALYIKNISLEKIYCCGVFGLSVNSSPIRPKCFKNYRYLEQIMKGRAVVLSPYAKSVVALSDRIWQQIVDQYLAEGYQCFTNVIGEEKALPGTKPISPQISELKSVVERAGIFVGIRSGLCDVLRDAKAKKIALYPDYNYCNTKWKAIDMYSIEGWSNIVVKDDGKEERG